MSIRPIDMQVAVKGAQEVGVMKQNALNKQDNQLLNVQQQAAAEVRHDLQSVQSNVKTDSAELKRRSREEDGKRQAQSDSRERGQKKDGEERDMSESRYPKDKGRHIDIRI